MKKFEGVSRRTFSKLMTNIPPKTMRIFKAIEAGSGSVSHPADRAAVRRFSALSF
jgi:hypothetical protein